MASSSESGPPLPPAGDTLRDSRRDCQDWWSNRSTLGQKISSAAIGVACVGMTGIALAHSLGVFAGTSTTISWAHGTYTLAPRCTSGGFISMKIDNTTSASVTAEVDEPGYYGPRPLYLRKNSDNAAPTVFVPANGSVTVYVKLGEKSLECSNDATDVLKVVSEGPVSAVG